tara:strand:+ start:382 stop:648 length:267 start_codon:yes stop_codon:yes gene_type:complete
MQVHPLGLQVSAGANSGAASTVSNSKLVYVFNTNAAEQLVTVEDAATGNAKASLLVGPDQSIILQKSGADEIFAGSADVKFTPVAYTN